MAKKRTWANVIPGWADMTYAQQVHAQRTYQLRQSRQAPDRPPTKPPRGSRSATQRREAAVQQQWGAGAPGGGIGPAPMGAAPGYRDTPWQPGMPVHYVVRGALEAFVASGERKKSRLDWLVQHWAGVYNEPSVVGLQAEAWAVFYYEGGRFEPHSTGIGPAGMGAADEQWCVVLVVANPLPGPPHFVYGDFASGAMDRASADQLAAEMGGKVVTLEECRAIKRRMQSQYGGMGGAGNTCPPCPGF